MKQDNKTNSEANYNPTDRNFQRPNADNSQLSGNINEGADNIEEKEDTDPPLTEEDLQENNLTDQEADNIIWDKPNESQTQGS
ncbi:MAG: hypothetical protein ACTHJ0_11715 [Flavipsychrobacter sp.]